MALRQASAAAWSTSSSSVLSDCTMSGPSFTDAPPVRLLRVSNGARAGNSPGPWRRLRLPAAGTAAPGVPTISGWCHTRPCAAIGSVVGASVSGAVEPHVHEGAEAEDEQYHVDPDADPAPPQEAAGAIGLVFDLAERPAGQDGAGDPSQGHVAAYRQDEADDQGHDGVHAHPVGLGMRMAVPVARRRIATLAVAGGAVSRWGVAALAVSRLSVTAVPSVLRAGGLLPGGGGRLVAPWFGPPVIGPVRVLRVAGHWRSSQSAERFPIRCMRITSTDTTMFVRKSEEWCFVDRPPF